MNHDRRTPKTGIMLVGGFMLLLAVLNLCAALSPVGYSDLWGGIGGTTITSGLSDAVEDRDEATNPIPTRNETLNTLGVIGIVLSLALGLVGVSFLMLRAWAYIGAIVMLGAYVLLAVIGVVARDTLESLSIIQAVLVVLSVLAVLYLLVSSDVKQQFAKRT